MAATVDKIFDEAFYDWKYPDVQAGIKAGLFTSGFDHYLKFGRNEHRQLSGYFNEQYYLQKYQDVAQAVQQGVFRDGLQHFLQFGQYFKERRSSSDLIDQNWLYNYELQKNPQVAGQIARDEITGVQYFANQPKGQQYQLTAERAFLTLWNDKDFNTIDQVTTGSAFIDHNVFQVLPGLYDGGQPGKLIGGPETPGGQPGTEGIKQTAQLFIDAMPNIVLEQKEFASDGNKLIIRWEENGTQTQAFGAGRYFAGDKPLNEALNVPALLQPTQRKFQGIIVAYFNPEGKMYERFGYPLGHETTTNFLEMGVPLPGIQERIQPVPNQQVDLVKQTYTAFQQGNIPAVLNNLADNIEWDSQYTPNVPFAGEWDGKTGVTNYLNTVNRTVDILNFTPQNFTAEGNTVIVRGSEQIRVKATGREYKNNWVHIWDIEGGKVDKITTYNDTAAVAAAF